MAHHITDADGNLIEVAGNFKDADINTVIANFQKQIDNLEKKLSKRYLVDSYVSSDGTSWYNIYSDGWKECGGRVNRQTLNYNYQVNFPVTFQQAPLNVGVAGLNLEKDSQVSWYAYAIRSITTNSMKFMINVDFDRVWYASGY